MGIRKLEVKLELLDMEQTTGISVIRSTYQLLIVMHAICFTTM